MSASAHCILGEHPPGRCHPPCRGSSRLGGGGGPEPVVAGSAVGGSGSDAVSGRRGRRPDLLRPEPPAGDLGGGSTPPAVRRLRGRSSVVHGHGRNSRMAQRRPEVRSASARVRPAVHRRLRHDGRPGWPADVHPHRPLPAVLRLFLRHLRPGDVRLRRHLPGRDGRALPLLQQLGATSAAEIAPYWVGPGAGCGGNGDRLHREFDVVVHDGTHRGGRYRHVRRDHLAGPQQSAVDTGRGPSAARQHHLRRLRGGRLRSGQVPHCQDRRRQGPLRLDGIRRKLRGSDGAHPAPLCRLLPGPGDLRCEPGDG